MEIEKLSNNKLKIIFSINELEKENIDYLSFMSGSKKCENLISNLLYIAQDELDFDTKNSTIEIETFELKPGNFVLTITKFEKQYNKLIAKRKMGNIDNSKCIYEFENINNYYNFIDFFELNFKLSDFKKLNNKLKSNSEIIEFSNKIFFIIDGSCFSSNESKIFNTCITEFANFKSNSEALISKLKELLL